MAQIHLETSSIQRIIDGRQTAVVYAIARDVFKVGDVISVREPWAVVDDEVIYRASTENWREIKWSPSIHMKATDVRLYLEALEVHQLNLVDVFPYLGELGHTSTEELYREWNISLSKDKRPTLGAKKNPLVWFIKFTTKST